MYNPYFSAPKNEEAIADVAILRRAMEVLIDLLHGSELTRNEREAIEAQLADMAGDMEDMHHL